MHDFLVGSLGAMLGAAWHGARGGGGAARRVRAGCAPAALVAHGAQISGIGPLTEKGVENVCADWPLGPRPGVEMAEGVYPARIGLVASSDCLLRRDTRGFGGGGGALDNVVNASGGLDHLRVDRGHHLSRKSPRVDPHHSAWTPPPSQLKAAATRTDVPSSDIIPSVVWPDQGGGLLVITRQGRRVVLERREAEEAARPKGGRGEGQPMIA
jgi:hypothetical protein